MTYEDLITKFKALSDPNRLKIVQLLSEECKCVCKIEESLGLSQNLVSHHLKVLKNAGLVEVCKCGNWRNYSLKKEVIEQVKNQLENFLITQNV